jgi:hypothetical protein
MWSGKVTSGIHADSLGKDVGNIKKANAVVIKLKDLIGLRKYMRDAEIEKIFSKQKWRIGRILDQIDTQLMTQPPPGYTAWKKQDLKKLWDTYMNMRFETGKSRIDHDMRRHLRKLEVKYTPVGKPPPKAGLELQVHNNVKRLSKEWNKEKGLAWKAPWVKRPIGDDGAFT